MGQKILLCSDGLTDCVSNPDIEKVLSGPGTDQEIADELIARALEGGGKDNVTVIVVSAPDSSGKPDSDTHVPKEVGDNTRISDTTSTRRSPRADVTSRKR